MQPDGSDASAIRTSFARERLRDVAGEPAQELVPHGARRALGDRREQLLASEPAGCGGRNMSSIVPGRSGHT